MEKYFVRLTFFHKLIWNAFPILTHSIACLACFLDKNLMGSHLVRPLQGNSTPDRYAIIK